MEKLKEEQKQEAINRLKKLTKEFNLSPKILENFEQGKLCYGEDIEFRKTVKLHTLEENSEYLKLVKDFEKRNNALVYYCILTPAKFILSNLEGYHFSLLYVSEYNEDWEEEKLYNINKLASGYKYAFQYTYTYNLHNERCSEHGAISVYGADGTLGRDG